MGKKRPTIYIYIKERFFHQVVGHDRRGWNYAGTGDSSYAGHQYDAEHAKEKRVEVTVHGRRWCSICRVSTTPKD